MSKKEEFKLFASKNKYLSDLVREGKTTWQSLFETYDIYGSDASIWDDFKNDYKKEEKKTTKRKNTEIERFFDD